LHGEESEEAEEWLDELEVGLGKGMERIG